MSNDDVVEQAAKVLARAWKNMHTNESLGFQRMLAGALADAGLLARPLPDRDEIADVLRSNILGASAFAQSVRLEMADAVLELLKERKR